MAVNDEFIPLRKAFSAEKSKDILESVSSDSGFDEIGNRTFKVCSSASYLSARERRHEQQILDTSLLENFNPRYLKVHGRANQKLFLQSSQILEKLSKIIANSTNHFQSTNNDSIHRKLSLQKVILYHDKLKILMMERSSIALLEECDVCLKRTIKLIHEFKQLYVYEKVKMTTMPMQAFNRFISSSDVNVSSLELLIKKLKAICDMHASLSVNYQNIINRFHMDIHIELHENFLKINHVLINLKLESFYWSHKCVKLFLQKLCLADPNSISPEFLQVILKSIYVYNSIITDYKLKFKLSRAYSIFYEFIIHHEYDISFDFVLQYLSFFEAKVASERIVNFLTSSCKKHRQADLKQKLLKNDRKNSDTIAYNQCKNDLELSNLKLLTTDSLYSGFVNALLSIMQRNQSLVLKYMFAFTSLENAFVIKSKNDTFENKSPCSSARQMWDLPQLYNKDENYIYLEEKYWINFWSNIKKCVLKLLLDVPYHQYGDSATGTIILWPESFVSILSESLKISSQNNDLSLEGRHTMKEIYDYLTVHQAKLLWDREFSISLSTTQSHLCPAVTISPNQMRTVPGNSLNKCLSILLEIFLDSLLEMDSVLYLPVFLHLQATLDTYTLWVNNKTRALIASQNLPTYLLISSSDCSDAKNQLEDKAVQLISELSFSNTSRRLHPLHVPLYKTLLKQIDNFCGYVPEATIIIHNYYFTAVKELLLFLVLNSSRCQNCFKTEINIIFDTLDDILSPVTHTLANIRNAYDIIQCITYATSGAFFFVLRNEERLWNMKIMQVVHLEYEKFMKWLEKLNLSHSDFEKLKQSHQIEKLSSIMRLIQDFYSTPRSCLKRRNRVAPQLQLERMSSENVLSDQEKTYWQEKCNKSRCFPCI